MEEETRNGRAGQMSSGIIMRKRPRALGRRTTFPIRRLSYNYSLPQRIRRKTLRHEYNATADDNATNAVISADDI